jgi:hypothetical protein
MSRTDHKAKAKRRNKTEEDKQVREYKQKKKLLSKGEE